MVKGAHTHTHTHTHTQPFNGHFSRPFFQDYRYQKGKTNLDFTEARDGEWQWHQLGHMQVCTSLQTDNHASTPPLCLLQAGCPSCRPTNSVKALKGAQSDPNYVSRLLLDCVPVFHKIITPAYLVYHSGPVTIYYSEIYSLFYGTGHIVTSSLTSSPVANVRQGAQKL